MRICNCALPAITGSTECCKYCGINDDFANPMPQQFIYPEDTGQYNPRDDIKDLHLKIIEILLKENVNVDVILKIHNLFWSDKK